MSAGSTVQNDYKCVTMGGGRMPAVAIKTLVGGIGVHKRPIHHRGPTIWQQQQ